MKVPAWALARKTPSNDNESSPSSSYLPPTPRANDNAQPSASQVTSNSEPYQWEARHSTPNELTNSVVRTVVSSGNDALNLLFEAAAHDRQNTSSVDQSTSHPIQSTNPAQGTSQYNVFPMSTSFSNSHPGPSPVKISHPSPDVLRTWETCRFVRMGWFSAREAVTYIDAFFQNMAPLSPILTDFHSRHENHCLLVTQEPMLCCTILMISSRYHTLPGVGGASRGFSIHHRLWQHCQHLIMRLILGQEKGSKAKTRTIGTIEALLLMTEWHPRALHFPPESDGWDSDLVLNGSGAGDSTNTIEDTSNPSRQWIEDVIEPARRSDRMSWMLLGSGLSLSHELGVFEADGDDYPGKASGDGEASNNVHISRQRIRRLLYVFINQHASRLGCMSLMPQTLNRSIVAGLPTGEAAEDEWQSFTNSWVELTRLTTSVSDMLFPSTSFTRRQLHNGRYISLLDHFRPLLTQWKEKYFESKNLKVEFRDILFIEYQYVRVYINSFGMQAVVERELAQNSDISHGIGSIDLNDIDYEFIQEVVDGSCQILRRITKIAELGALKFSPVRVFLRITSCSIFLLKALSLGVRNAKLHESLDILERSILALRSSTLDDIHLGSRYASLLDVHVSRLRRSFMASSKHSRPSQGVPTRPSSTGAPRAPPPPHNSGDPINTSMGSLGAGCGTLPAGFDGIWPDDDWLSLPFDPSMAPFGTGSGTPAFPDFDEGALDFVWNLPP
ncbi:hypothetical protein FQN54_006387 [Arachnomyces sp. PD_36]|nr:hypothetical protein FQN54_006387 [Arachnomyces sp. PD_36]